jgi:hypothetical protein
MIDYIQPRFFVKQIHRVLTPSGVALTVASEALYVCFPHFLLTLT